MQAVFVETKDFTEWVSRFLPDANYARLQHELMANPDMGAVIQGCGGLRKIRIGDPQRGKGKRGGARVIYLYVPEVKRFYMLDIYDKDDLANLSAQGKKLLARMAVEIKRQVRPNAS